MKLQLKIYGDPVLRSKTKLISFFDTHLEDLSNNMIDIMNHNNGIGLAAPQVGIKRRMFVVDMRLCQSNYSFQVDGKKISEKSYFPLAMINPKIKSLSKELCTYPEGCISIPNVYLNITRNYCICLYYQDIKGKKHYIKANGYFARCIQHEIDHLEGILHLDHIKPSELIRYQNKLKKIRRNTKNIFKK